MYDSRWHHFWHTGSVWRGPSPSGNRVEWPPQLSSSSSKNTSLLRRQTCSYCSATRTIAIDIVCESTPWTYEHWRTCSTSTCRLIPNSSGPASQRSMFWRSLMPSEVQCTRMGRWTSHSGWRLPIGYIFESWGSVLSRTIVHWCSWISTAFPHRCSLTGISTGYTWYLCGTDTSYLKYCRSYAQCRNEDGVHLTVISAVLNFEVEMSENIFFNPIHIGLFPFQFPIPCLA